MPIERVRTFRGKEISLLTKDVRSGYNNSFVDSSHASSLRTGADLYKKVEIGDNDTMKISRIREALSAREVVTVLSLEGDKINDKKHRQHVTTRKVLGFQTQFRYRE